MGNIDRLPYNISCVVFLSMCDNMIWTELASHWSPVPVLRSDWSEWARVGRGQLRQSVWRKEGRDMILHQIELNRHLFMNFKIQEQSDLDYFTRRMETRTMSIDYKAY